MGCGTGLVKYFVFFTNLVFAAAGLVLIGIGIVFKVKYGAATSALPTDFGLAPILSIIIGCIVFVTATMGCCGAFKESPCMLTTYSVILLVIFAVQVGIGIYAFVTIQKESEFREAIHKALKGPFSKYEQSPEAKETVDVIQRLLSCCGVDGPDEYAQLLGNNTLPISCCPTTKTNNPCLKDKENLYYHDACARSLFNVVMDNATIFGGTAIGICIIELLGAILGLCLASSIKNHYRRSLYA